MASTGPSGETDEQANFNGNVNTAFGSLLGEIPQQLRFRAFPVDAQSKRPLVKRWQQPNRTPSGNSRRLNSYRSRFQHAGLGIRTGPDSDGDLAVIDVDAPLFLSEHQRDVLEDWPWLVSTHRGYHVYGRPPAVMRSIKRLPWGDFLAQSSYVVGPGNQHKSGILYRALPGWGGGDLPSFPAALLADRLRETGEPPPSPGGVYRQTLHPRPTGAFVSRLAEQIRFAKPGERYTSLFDLVRHWSYRQPQPDTLAVWERTVTGQALLWADTIRDRDGFHDSEVQGLAKKVAGWTYGKHFRRRIDPVRDRYAQVLSREAVRAANQPRNAAIFALHADGHSLRDIAERVGVSHMTAKRVIQRGAGIAATPEELARAFRKQDSEVSR